MTTKEEVDFEESVSNSDLSDNNSEKKTLNHDLDMLNQLLGGNITEITKLKQKTEKQ